ncbi:helix-turn-helix transcriptional regulator [Citrobacter koseri]|uniref:helix-turn-helix transcriptional regulator n=1 Tax=Citrobacter koseri TaxID=545 RepID=UPI000DF0E96A|nr:LuxR C-terminal-related transcriptional regulator [Citrobacter koseri]STB73665.1 DNA-binding transcriptional activator UhpA [Citrobacter koseri]
MVIYSNNSYLKEHIAKRYDKIKVENASIRIELHFYDEPILCISTFKRILYNKSDLVLVYCSLKNILFLCNLKLPSNIILERISAPVSEIDAKIIKLCQFNVFNEKFLGRGKVGYSLQLKKKGITKRERLILFLFITGFSVNEITNVITSSYKTVSTHKKNIKHKLGISSDVDLLNNRAIIALALREGLI